MGKGNDKFVVKLDFLQKFAKEEPYEAEITPEDNSSGFTRDQASQLKKLKDHSTVKSVEATGSKITIIAKSKDKRTGFENAVATAVNKTFSGSKFKVKTERFIG